ncbi:MAG TPA: thiol reductant ABC exporter subunit CydD, partial [Mycobacteriales bacterium]|nr:thiol reductant ABC exporter subunit CydD [Mycobacteriales bacterium]
MKALDPRLLRHAAAARAHVLTCVVIGLLRAALIIAQAGLLATLITRAFLDGAGIAGLRTPLVLLTAVVGLRAVLAWFSETVAASGALKVTSQLRECLLRKVMTLGPAWLDRRHSGELALLATTGIDALQTYVRRYLPQVILAMIVPIAVLTRIFLADWISGLIIAITLPLIPLFMILVGTMAAERTRRQWRTLQVLGHHFLDVITGLPTLKVFGRAKAQRATIAALTGKYRVATMRTLRVAFLSALVLELLATLSVALVAVSVGLRLVDGRLDLYPGLVVLVLAPEAYWPLRQLGAEYHSSTAGLAAAEQILDILAEDGGPPTQFPAAPIPDPRLVPISLERVWLHYEGRTEHALRDRSLVLQPGTVTGLVGPSGCGKSTILALVTGFVSPARGRILIGDTDLADLDRSAWHRQLAWVPQNPHLFGGTVSENIRLGRPGARPECVAEAAAIAAVDVPLDTQMAEGGGGLSTGQRRRIALARAII